MSKAPRNKRCALALGFTLGAMPAFADGLYLFVIPTLAPAANAVSLDGPLQLRVVVSDPAAFAAIVETQAPPVGSDHIDFTLAAYPQLGESPSFDDRAASWVVDYEDASVRQLRTEAVARFGEHPSAKQLTGFVAESVDGASSVRGFDVASRVARDRTGDCTEHAVLLTALARSFGLRARVVLGLALVLQEGRLQSYGHAWTEVRDGERWVVADAALDEPALSVRYLPFGALTDEGPGYMLMIASLTPVWVKQLELRGGGSTP